MFRRIRLATGFAFVAALLMVISALAKGEFSFITITGANLKSEIRSDDPALTREFFAFADFYRDRTSAPANPGTGYEITRYYLDGSRDIVFDSLHYYPESGFVYYDGIAGGGSSEYDGGWYTAQPEIKAVFETALVLKPGSSPASTVQAQPGMALPPAYLVALGVLGMAIILFFTYRIRKPFS